jgi:hypothetical protein
MKRGRTCAGIWETRCGSPGQGVLDSGSSLRKFYHAMESPIPPAGESMGDTGRFWGGDVAWAAVAAAIVICLYWWTATEGLDHTGSPGGNAALLNKQVEAFHAGRLSLMATPDARLLAAADPYDPAVNRGTRLLDATLYGGKYYTYFGPVPILLFMWPWYACTGSHPPPDLTAFLLGSGAFAFQAAFLLFAKRTWFPGVRPAWLGLGVVAVGAGNLFQPLLRAHSTFEIPILSEMLFASASVFFVAVALGAKTRCLWAWCAASLCFGLAAGSRPNFIPAGAAFVATFWLAERRREKLAPIRHFGSRFALVAIPGALCICGLLAYNFARFGNPFEFGNRYTLVEVDWRQRSAFSIRYALANIFFYGFSVPRLSAWFPFFIESAPLPFAPPSGYLDYVDRVAGFIPAYPFGLVGIVACVGACRSPSLRAYRQLVATLTALAGLMAIPLVLFIGSSLRYQAEMAFPIFLLAGLGTLVAGRQFSRVAPPIWLAPVVALLALCTTLSNFLISCATYGYFKTANPAAYQVISTAFSDISYSIERRLGWEPRIPRLRVRFPANRPGQLEPLWVNGRVPEADFLYVYYVTPQAIQVGFESMGRGGPVSGLIPVDYSKFHDLDIVAGPFLPPASHPYFARADLGTGRPLPDLLRVILDGHIIVDAIVNFHDGRGLRTWGASEDEFAFGKRFSGEAFSVSSHRFDPSLVRDVFQPGSYGDVLLDLKWPEPVPVGDEPLLSVGAKNRGEMVFVRFDGTHRARIGVSVQNGETSVGAPLDLTGPRLRLTLSLPALYPGLDWSTFAPNGTRPNRNTVSADGREIFEGPAPSLLVGPTSVVAGRNTLMASGTAPAFSGSLEPVSRHWDSR